MVAHGADINSIQRLQDGGYYDQLQELTLKSRTPALRPVLLRDKWVPATRTLLHSCNSYVPNSGTPREVADGFLRMVDVLVSGDRKKERVAAVTDSYGWIDVAAGKERARVARKHEREAKKGRHWNVRDVDLAPHTRVGRTMTLLKRLLAILCVGTAEEVKAALTLYPVREIEIAASREIHASALPRIVTNANEFKRFMVGYWRYSMGDVELGYIRHKLGVPGSADRTLFG